VAKLGLVYEGQLVEFLENTADVAVNLENVQLHSVEGLFDMFVEILTKLDRHSQVVRLHHLDLLASFF